MTLEEFNNRKSRHEPAQSSTLHETGAASSESFNPKKFGRVEPSLYLVTNEKPKDINTTNAMLHKPEDTRDASSISRQLELMKSSTSSVTEKVSRDTSFHQGLSNEQKPETSCCMNCAKYYSLFPSLVCCRPSNSDAECLLCMATRKGPCVTVKARFKPFLVALQDAAQNYTSAPTPQTLELLEKHQKKFNKMTKDWRKNAEKIANPVNQEAHTDFCLNLIFKQQAEVSTALTMPRKMPRSRTSFDIRNGHHIWDLDLSKIRHLESAAAQLVGQVSKKQCKNCAKGKGPFHTCVVVENHDGAALLNDSCANCVYAGHHCCFEEEEL